MTEDRAKIPSWLKKAYLQEILQRKYSSNLEVQSFTAVPPVAAGNNYASLILRAKVQCIENGVKQEHSLIIKTVHFDEESAKLFEEFGAHKNEMTMYSDILPRVQSLLESIGDHDKISPGSIYIDQDHQAMIFEDLKDSNYKLGDRKIGLDWDHMKIIARKHAKLHACSMVLAEQGEQFTDFQRGIFSEDVHAFDPFFILMCSEFGVEVKTWPGYEKYGDKLIKVSEKMIETGIEVYRKKPGQLCVLNHGDSWTNNMMFKYDVNDAVTDAVLIDFQVANYNSPIFDLIYFFNTSANDEVKFNHWKFHELIRVYHEHLTETLWKLSSKVQPPTLYQLQQEYYQRSFIGVVFITMFPVMINENEADANVQSLIGTTDENKAFRKQLFTHPKSIRTMKHFLPIWDAQGLLDPL